MAKKLKDANTWDAALELHDALLEELKETDKVVEVLEKEYPKAFAILSSWWTGE